MGLAGCRMTETFKPARLMTIEGTHPDKLHFEGSVWDRTAACGMVSESQKKKKRRKEKNEGTLLLLLK